VKISYGITVYNEANELNKLLEILIHKTDKEDEIVICVDPDKNGDMDDAVWMVIQSWSQQYADAKMIKVYQRELNKDFAAQKNSVIENSTGDYIFHIDADEYPNEILLQQLKEIIEMNDGIDLIWIPRVNTIEDMKQRHIDKWGWRVSEKGWVNYPDYQARVFRNDEKIRWERPLHELITGCKTYSHLPPQEELSLYHPKTIEKQEKQNMFYNQNFSEEMNVRKGNDIL
jgi:glycosyltransferase involved in cell wall biosynthesis